MASLLQNSLAPFFSTTKIPNAFHIAQSGNSSHFSNVVTNSKPKLSEFSSGKLKRLQRIIGMGKNRRDQWKVWGTDDGSCGIVPSWSPPPSVLDLIRKFYDAINTKNVPQLKEILLEDSVYQDLIFYVPFEGKANIINFLENVMDAMGPNVRFVLDNIAEGDNFTTMALWHLEWNGKELPFSSGCSFFECTEQEKKQYIRKIRGVEELPVKPGELVLKLLKAMSGFFDRFPFAAEGILLKSRDGSHEGIQMILDLLGLGKH